MPPSASLTHAVQYEETGQNHVRSEICTMVARVKRLTVVIAHESATVRVGARRAVESDEIQVVAEAADAETAIAVTLRHCPDVCLVSTRLPGSGVAAVGQISSALPDTKIVMLSHSDDDLFDALRAGA